MCNEGPIVSIFVLCAVNETGTFARALIQSEDQHTSLPYEDTVYVYCQEVMVDCLCFTDPSFPFLKPLMAIDQLVLFLNGYLLIMVCFCETKRLLCHFLLTSVDLFRISVSAVA